MFWIALVFAIPSLALAAAVWGVVRRKWYGVLPLLAVAAAGWLFQDRWWDPASDFLEACTNRSPQNQVMLLLLADGAAVMSLAALWAGWSRGPWFWRGLALAVVPASLVPLEAGELILVCFVSMPLLATAAWLLRRREDQIRRAADANVLGGPESPAPSRRQFTLLSLFLAFIVLGLVASSLRALITGHVLLVESGVLWMGLFVTVAALAAASPLLARKIGFRWLLGSAAGLAFAYALWQWLDWKIDPLGLVTYLQLSRFPKVIAVYQLEATGCFLIAVALVGSLHVLTERWDKSTLSGKLARFAPLLLLLLLLTPLAVVYRQMIPLRPTVSPLPTSPAYQTIQRAGLQIRRLESENAVRERFLSAFLQLDRELPQPGHITYDPGELIREQLYPRGVDPDELLHNELGQEISRAFHEGRTADALRLARLQWRLGQSYYVGGTINDYIRGSSTIAYSTNPAVIAAAPSLSDQECRELLAESQKLEQAEPDFQTLHDFDEYWRRIGVGWRENLHDAAGWLIGAKNSSKYERFSQKAFQQWQPRARASQHTVQYVLALELFRHEHGKYPESLEEVQSAYNLPALSDPFTEQPRVVYRRALSGYLLYSRGANGRDDGGEFLPPSQLIAIPWPDQPDINIAVGPSDMAIQWRRAAGLPLTTPAAAKPASSK